jgi:hypothetical protein
MKNVMLVLAGILIAVVAFGVAGFAYAQTQNPPDQFPQGYGLGMMGSYGRGMMGGYGGGMMRNGAYGPMHTYMVDAFAEALGIAPEELQAKIEAGETMWQIAQAQGLSDEELSALMLEARSDALQKAVEAGALTQEQANWMTQHMQQSGMTPGTCHGAGGGWRWNNAPQN